MTAITNRHDILILFDVTNGNPNGDPDAGNLPRIDPTTNKGLVSDVCLKRKVRNFITQFPPTRNADDTNGFSILVQQGNILNDKIKEGIAKGAESLGKATDKQKAEAAMKWLCREFYDVRTFGGVLSTGDDVLKGSAYGQVRGPVQFTFGRSVDVIAPLEISITRCAVTKPEDEKKERTMGNKHIVPYALYVAKAYISPVFAERTGFDDEDLRLFFEALEHMFTHDQSAARAEMNVRAIYDFEHVGTQGPENAVQNAREAKLGCAHAHQLFAGVLQKLKLADGKEFPESFEDYAPVRDAWTTTESGEIVLPGVRLHRRVVPQ
jgi:CRISPR-associated protein Csd2